MRLASWAPGRAAGRSAQGPRVAPRDSPLLGGPGCRLNEGKATDRKPSGGRALAGWTWEQLVPPRSLLLSPLPERERQKDRNLAFLSPFAAPPRAPPSPDRQSPRVQGGVPRAPSFRGGRRSLKGCHRFPQENKRLLRPDSPGRPAASPDVARPPRSGPRRHPLPASPPVPVFPRVAPASRSASESCLCASQSVPKRGSCHRRLNPHCPPLPARTPARAWPPADPEPRPHPQAPLRGDAPGLRR